MTGMPAATERIEHAVRVDAPPETTRKKKALSVPRFVREALKGTPNAWENFRRLAPSYRREYVGWITEAKREETRERRLKEAAALLAQNKKLGMK